MRSWARWLLLAGVVLILPAALTFTPALGSLTNDEDAAVAFVPAARLSLDSLKSGGTVRMTHVVPDSAQWSRIRRNASMGDHGYIAFVADTLHGQILPFRPLDLDVSVSSGSRQLPLTFTGHGPYLYEAASPGDVGLRFPAAPGERLQISVRARQPEHLPDAELLVQPYWEWTAQDFGEVGSGIDRTLRPLVTRAAQIGLILLAMGAVLTVISGLGRSE